MLPLTTADLLSHAIVGSVLENLDMERLVREVGHAVAQRILGNNESVDDVARELHEKLLLRNESTKKVVIESIYKESPEATHNVSVFMHASSLAEARGQLKRVRQAMHGVQDGADPPGSIGAWDTVHGQISACTASLQPELIFIFLCPSYSLTNTNQAYIRSKHGRYLCLPTTQGGHRLCGVWCASKRERVRDCCCFDAFFAGRRKSCIWRNQELRWKGSF